MSKTKLVIGLGNIGDRYATTRHNVGFMVIDRLAMQLGGGQFTDKSRFSAEICETEQDGTKIILAKPTTMMNASGRAVQTLKAFYKVENDDIWVISDDVDLPFGELRVRHDGGAGGHQGLVSIIEAIGGNFRRLRIGIGDNRPHGLPSEAYVLQPFTPEERAELEAHILQDAIGELNLS